MSVSCIKWCVLTVLFVLTVFNVSCAFFPFKVKLTEASSSWHLNSVEEQVLTVNENSKAISRWNFPTIYLKPSMTSVASWLSLMRPVWWGGEPRSSITVTRRRSSSHSDFWVKQEQTDVEILSAPQPSLTFSAMWCEQQLPRLYHDVLQLVVCVRYVGRRQYEQPLLFKELIQESRDCLHIWFNLHGCKHKVTILRSHPPLQSMCAASSRQLSHFDEDSRTHWAGSPSQSRLNWQTRLATPWSSYPPLQWYSHVAP